MIDVDWFLPLIFGIVIVTQLIEWGKGRRKRPMQRRPHGQVGFIESDITPFGLPVSTLPVGSSRARRREQAVNKIGIRQQQAAGFSQQWGYGSNQRSRRYNYDDLEYSFSLGVLFQGIFSSEDLISEDSDRLENLVLSDDSYGLTSMNDMHNISDSSIHSDLSYYSDLNNNYDLSHHHDSHHHDTHHHDTHHHDTHHHDTHHHDTHHHDTHHHDTYHHDTYHHDTYHHDTYHHCESDHFQNTSTDSDWYSQDSSYDSDW